MRVLATILAFAIIGAIAFFLARSFFSEDSDESTPGGEVFTGAYNPRLDECRVLADSELPRDIEIGKDTIHMLISILYPDTPSIPQLDKHRVEEVNGTQGVALEPVSVDSEYVDGEGTYVSLIYRIDGNFEFARLTHRGKVILKRLELE